MSNDSMHNDILSDKMTLDFQSNEMTLDFIEENSKNNFLDVISNNTSLELLSDSDSFNFFSIFFYIYYYIMTDNVHFLRKILNKTNINSIIDNSRKDTALHIALKFNSNNTIIFLLENDADPYIKNNHNLDSFDISIIKQNNTLVHYLMNNPEKKNILITHITYRLWVDI